MTNDPNAPDHAAPDLDPSVDLSGDLPGPSVRAAKVYPGPSSGGKHLVAAVTAVLLAVMTYLGSAGDHLLPSQYAQVVAVGLLALGTWGAQYNPTWWKSAKAYVLGGQALAAALAPAIANSLDGRGFNLTGHEWLLFAVAVVGAVTAVVIPNAGKREQWELAG